MTSAIRYPRAEAQSESRDWSILAQALSLQESGILVQGMSVTDLSTGFCVEGPPEAMSPEYLQVQHDAPQGKHSMGEDVALWGTSISIARLGELIVLLEEVLQQRKENPEAASVNPTVPRETFPWGIGLETVDILVAGAHAKIVAAYLRVMGYRARVVHEDSALQVAAELTALPSSLPRPVGTGNAGSAIVETEQDPVGTHNADREIHREEDVEPDMVVERSAETSFREEPDHSREDTGILKALIAVALVVVVAGVGVTIASVVAAHRDPEERQDAGSVASPQEELGETNASTSEAETSLPTPRADQPHQEEKQKDAPLGAGRGKKDEAFEDPHKMGGKREADAPRADVPTSVGVPGWNRVGATRGREEYRSRDEGMRVLIAAKPSPIRRQGDLDQAVLKALQKAKGVKVVQQSPVVYEEQYPGSITQWHVVLKDGHQVSVGCQFRERNAQRDQQCEKVRDMAKPE